MNINYLIKSYFNLYFNHKFIGHKYISRKKKRKSMNKVYISKAEIKHTSSKAIITIYVYNRERLAILNSIKNNLWLKLFFNRKTKEWERINRFAKKLIRKGKIKKNEILM